MNLLLDFIEVEFGLRPVESPGESIVFLPQFVAIVGVALERTSIWISLYGAAHQFDGNDTVAGQYPTWRKFHVQNRRPDIARAKTLILRACENYKRDQPVSDWDEMIRFAEQRWIDNRNAEERRDRMRRLIEEL
jgi:hypothetical protein